MEEHSLRLTTGPQPSDPRDEKCSSYLAAFHWADAYLILQNLFMQGMSGNRKEWPCTTEIFFGNGPHIVRCGRARKSGT